MTTSAGCPIADNQNSLTAGERGPVLLQDYQLIEKLAHQNRERIPERVVHAKGWELMVLSKLQIQTLANTLKLNFYSQIKKLKFYYAFLLLPVSLELPITNAMYGASL